MNRTQLLRDLLERPPITGETVYLERTGSDYTWRFLDIAKTLAAPGNSERAPDAWLYYSGTWPDDPARLSDHLDDMLAEMDSMCGGRDRCRWPLDQPYPHRH